MQGMNNTMGSAANMGGAQMPGGIQQAQAMQGSPAPQQQPSAIQQAMQAAQPQPLNPQQLAQQVDPTKQGMDLNGIYENFMSTLNQIRGGAGGQVGDVMNHPLMQNFMSQWLGQSGQQQGGQPQPQQGQPAPQISGQTPQGAQPQTREPGGPMQGNNLSRFNTVMATSKGGDASSGIGVGATAAH